MFEVGMEVVRVLGKGNGRKAAPGYTPPPCGMVVIIDGIYGCADWTALVFKSFPSGHVTIIGLDGWDATGFRPLRDNEASARQQWAEMLAGKIVEKV